MPMPSQPSSQSGHLQAITRRETRLASCYTYILTVREFPALSSNYSCPASRWLLPSVQQLALGSLSAAVSLCFDIGKMQRVHGLNSQHLMQLDEATSHWQDSTEEGRSCLGAGTIPSSKTQSWKHLTMGPTHSRATCVAHAA